LSHKRSRLALSAFGACQPLTVEKIVAQHIEALGGQQKIAAIDPIWSAGVGGSLQHGDLLFERQVSAATFRRVRGFR